MSTRVRLLVVGPQELREQLRAALPQCEVVSADRPVDAVWQSGQQRFDGVILPLSAGNKTLQAVRSLRESAPTARIVVCCSPSDEPLAQQALAEGADEYVLHPLQREELETALRIGAPRGRRPGMPSQPSEEELLALGNILRDLGDGPIALLQRMTRHLRDVFGATGVVIEIDDLSQSIGDTLRPVLEESLFSNDQPIGRVALAGSNDGAYDASQAARLGIYARMIEAFVAQARVQEHWRELAWTDDLSTLRNRRYFEKSLDDLLTRASEQRLQLTVLLFDIDNFKDYNDRFGHETGDELIREVAQLLRRCTRERDIVARYGGDEFAVVFWDSEKPRVPGSKHPNEPMALADRFCRALEDHQFKCLGRQAPGPVTISGGLAMFPWHGHSREQLLRAADDALMSAKRTGKNRIQIAGERSSETSGE